MLVKQVEATQREQLRVSVSLTDETLKNWIEQQTLRAYLWADHKDLQLAAEALSKVAYEELAQHPAQGELRAILQPFLIQMGFRFFSYRQGWLCHRQYAR